MTLFPRGSPAVGPGQPVQICNPLSKPQLQKKKTNKLQKKPVSIISLAFLSGEAPLLDQGSLYLLLERVGVLADFQLVYAELAASCSAMAAAVASFHDPKQVPPPLPPPQLLSCPFPPSHTAVASIYNHKQARHSCCLACTSSNTAVASFHNHSRCAPAAVLSSSIRYCCRLSA